MTMPKHDFNTSNHTTPSSARNTSYCIRDGITTPSRTYYIKLWIWDHIINTKHGWYWFISDITSNIDFRKDRCKHMTKKELLENLKEECRGLGYD